MSILSFIRRLLSPGFEQRPQEKETRYDNVHIKNVVDGTTIQGHDAIKAYFKQEEELYGAYGSSIIFQVFQINLQADTLQDFQGNKLAEIKVESDLVSGTDTVAQVKNRVRLLIVERERSGSENGGSSLQIEPEDRITLIFNGRPMQDDKLFYADHFMMLPAWVQVFIHRCEFQQVAERAAELMNTGRDRQE